MDGEEDDDDDDETGRWFPSAKRPRLALDGQHSIWKGLSGKIAAMKTIDVKHYNSPQQSTWKPAIIESVARLSVCLYRALNLINYSCKYLTPIIFLSSLFSWSYALLSWPGKPNHSPSGPSIGSWAFCGAFLKLLQGNHRLWCSITFFSDHWP